MWVELIDVAAGQAVIVAPGERIGYSTPLGEAEYIAVWPPAFAPELVHRDE